MPPQAVAEKRNSEQAVREANQRFYQAFVALDLKQMESVWLHEDWVECVHPGWDLLLGWDEVRESWERIFANTVRMKIEISAVWVRIEGDVAWVACTEHVTSSFAGGFDESLLQTTNIFVCRRPGPEPAGDSGWRMVAHHASPVPAGTQPTLQ